MDRITCTTLACGKQTRIRGSVLSLVLVVILLVFVLPACTPHGAPTLRNFNIVSTEQEVELGKKFSQEVNKQYPLLRDGAVTGYIEELGQAVAAVSDRQDITYHFHVTESDEVNAFALPGGFIYVNRGLILKAENEAELVSVLAHETGHVAARHTAEHISKSWGLDLISSLLLGEQPDFWASQAVNLFGTAGLLAFSRADETEADLLGLRYMYRAGYDPQAMVTFLETILAERERRPGAVEQFFSTHPLTEDRIRRVEDEIRALPHLPDTLSDTTRFHRIQRRLQSS